MSTFLNEWRNQFPIDLATAINRANIAQQKIANGDTSFRQAARASQLETLKSIASQIVNFTNAEWHELFELGYIGPRVVADKLMGEIHAGNNGINNVFK